MSKTKDPKSCHKFIISIQYENVKLKKLQIEAKTKNPTGASL